MPIDAYSLCPGGTGKKVKFCCPDFVAELNKIDRMMEAEQHIACLQHIDQLLEHGRPRACLLAIKGLLLRLTGQVEPAQAHAAAFLQQFPDNPIALAEQAMLIAIGDDLLEGTRLLHRALEASGQQLEGRVYEAIGVIAEALMEAGDWLAAQALLRVQMTVADEDQEPLERLVALNRSPRIPLVMKSEPSLDHAPPDAPWAERLEEAFAPLAQIRWPETARRLEKLAAEVPDAALVWRSLATLRTWLADRAGAIDALRKYAALEVPLDDAVEAELLAMLLSPDPLGDLVEVLKLTWTVRDVDRLQEALLSEPRAVQLPFDPAAMAEEDSPPPRLICFLLNRAVPPSADGLTLETMPMLAGQAMLFGRQTDREARLEVLGVAADEAASLVAWLRSLAGDAVDAEARQETMGKMSASRELLQRKWHPPRGMAQEQLAAMAAQHLRGMLLEQWPARPLALLAGQTPRQAAADPAQRIKLLAAIMLLQMWCDESPVKFDFDELRGALGLPLPEPIHAPVAVMATLPLTRLARVMVEQLADDALLLGFRRAGAFGVRKPLRTFAQAIVERPSLEGRPERQQAFSALAQTAEDFQQALGYVEQGRQAALAAKQSCASWDLLELSLCFGRGQGQEAMRLIEHIERQHIREPNVAETLTHMLIEVGALRPDGTPAPMPDGPEGDFAPAADTAAEAGKLWTPDSQQAGQGGKIWTPD
jgi:hypothetical protein